VLVWARIVITNSAVFGLLLALVEGGSSLVLFVREAAFSVRQASVAWSHTVHDPDLGWVSAPDVFAPDMYGPGMYLRTNGRGFRNDQEIDDDALAPGRRRRVVCSGDSFTFGYGVGNHQTWCARLEAIAPCLEAVNLGQGGYGVDQAYLRYKRDAGGLRHDLHLFAFITNDFDRARSDTFNGYGKPLLKLDEGALTISNVPVPRRSFYVPWLTAIVNDVRDLRVFEVLDRVRRLLPAPVDVAADVVPDVGETSSDTRELAKKILEQAKQLTDQREGRLALVHLPTPGEYAPDARSRAWTAFLRQEAETLGVPFIDVVGQHRELSRSEAATLFGEHRHLSVEGNEYVARVIHRTLTGLHPAAELASDSERHCVQAFSGPTGS
jgi:hypothetical protein